MTTIENPNYNDFHVTLPVEHTHTEKLLSELAGIIRTEWSYFERENINELHAGIQGNNIIIDWDLSNTDKQIKEFIGGPLSSLLKHGWAITAIKSNRTYVARIHQSVTPDTDYVFEGDTTRNIYPPSVCEACNTHEATRQVPIYNEPDNFEERLENNNYIPRHWVRHMKLCENCDLPDSVEPYTNPKEPDFNPNDHPNYNPYE